MSIGLAHAVATPALGFDCLAPVPANVARQFAADGMRFVGRYLETLSAIEVTWLHAAGLVILPLSEAWSGTVLDAEVGGRRGATALAHARALGIAEGVHIWLDLEATQGNVQSVMEYVAAAAREIASGGYACGLYVGAGQPLSAAQLHALAPDRYWRGGSFGVPEPVCGFTVTQLPRLDRTIHGQRVDLDCLSEDFLGRTPVGWGSAV